MWAQRPRRNIARVMFLERTTRRQLMFDGLLAAAILALGLLPTIDLRSAPEFSREADALHFVLVVLLSAPLVLRRVYTVPVFIVILASWVIDRGLDYPGTAAEFGVGVAFYTIGAELDRRRSLQIGGAASGVVVLWTAIGALVLESVVAIAVVSSVISTATPLLLGREMHERRRRVDELR